jgi:hypothetical protein
VIAQQLSDRFSLLTAGLKAEQWRWLGAIALEHGLSRSVLLALGGEALDPKALDAWLKQSLTAGLLVPVGPTRALSLTSAPSRESGYALGPALGQLVLRELTQRGALKDLALATHGLLGARSVSDLGLALQLGDYRTFVRRFSVERLPRQTPLRTLAEWLRVSICEPFDAAWLRRTWGDDAQAIATRVLSESLATASPCQALYAWLSEVFSGLPEGEAKTELAGLLCEHALLRDRPDLLPSYAAALPRATGLGYAAARAFATGDVTLAQGRLDDLFGAALRGQHSAARRGPLPRCGAVTPILALLLCARDDEAASALAKRLLAVGVTDPERGAGRAFRLLLRYLDEPQSEHQRIDVHDLAADAGVWEILLVAHNAELHQKQAETRARFAQHLVRQALAWHAAGYDWIARQALELARALSAEHAAQERERLAPALTLDAPLVSLWDSCRFGIWSPPSRSGTRRCRRCRRSRAAS